MGADWDWLSINMAGSSRSSKMPRSSISSPTCALHHAAHLVSDPLSATRYPPWPRVEGLDRGATRHLPIARSRVLPLGREAIITIAHQYPLWAQATACMIQSKMLRSISLGSGRAVHGQSIRLSASVARSARTVTLDLLAMGRYGQA